MMGAAPKCVQGHSAFIFDRGGQRSLGPLLDLGDVRWERVRDGISEGQVSILGAACDRQREFINQLSPHRHELVIYRGGTRVWEGPLHRITDEQDGVTITAKDVLAYVFATPLSRVWDNSYHDHTDHTTTVTGRLEQIIEWELTHSRVQKIWNGTAWVNHTVPAWESLSPPINVVPHLDVPHYPNEARTAAKTLAYQMTVGELLASAGRTSGIDYTTVGRSIKIWDVSRSLGRIQPLTEADFYARLIVSQYGSDHIQSAYVVGQEGAYGQGLNLNNLDFYGPWTQVYTAYNEEGTNAPTEAELDSQARRNLKGRSPVPIEVRVPDNSGIILTDLLTIDHLVAGAQVPLLATVNGRPISQMQKFDHIGVQETPDGETVQVTLTPATAADSDEPDEED